MTTLNELINADYFDVELNAESDTIDYYVKEDYEIHFGKHEYAFFEVHLDKSVTGYAVTDKEIDFDLDAEIKYPVKVFKISREEIFSS
jgi:hypothetical protein